MDNPENAFEAEVELDQAALEQDRARQRRRTNHGNSEQSPLLGEQSQDSDAPEGYAEDFAHLPWYKRPSIWWVLAPFLVMALAFGGSITPKINLISDLVCRQYISDRQLADPTFFMAPVDFGGDNDQCRIPEVSSAVSIFMLWSSLISGILSAIVSPRLGALSDLYGRRPILILSSLGTLASEVITICAATYPETINVNWMLLSYALDGITGSFILSMAMANSYASDCVPVHRRNVAFGLFHGCLFSGLAVGPVLAGYIVKWTGKIVIIFWIMLGVHLSFSLFMLLFVPESVSKRRQDSAREKDALLKTTTGESAWTREIRQLNLLEPLKILCPTGPGSSPALRRNLIVLAAVDTIMFGVAMGSLTVLLIYVKYQFGWGTFESSKFMSIVNSVRVAFLVVILPIVTYYVRGKGAGSKGPAKGSDVFDLYTIRVGIFFDMLGYVGFSLARQGQWFTVSAVVAAAGGIASPALQSALTKHVPSDQTGQLLGATGLLHALARVVAPVVFNAIYSATVGKFTQTVYVCLGSTFGVAFIISWFVRPHVYYDEDEAIASMRDSVTDLRSQTEAEPVQTPRVPIVSAIIAAVGSFVAFLGFRSQQ